MGIRISGTQLVAAAANAGGIGIISALGLNSTYFCIVQALDKVARGDIENWLVFSGSNAGRTKRMMLVAELMAELVTN